MGTRENKLYDLHSHQNLRNLFETIPEMMGMLTGEDLRFEFVNRSYTYFFGSLPEAATAAEAHKHCPVIVTILKSVYQSGTSAGLKEHPIETEHGLRFFDLTFNARRNQDCKIDGVVFLGTDATQRVLERKKLEDSELRLKQAVRAAKLGFWDYDIEKDVLVWSSEAMEQWGVYKNKGSKKDVYAHLHPDDAPILKQRFDEAVATGKKYQVEVRIVRDDGTLIWVENQGDHVFRDGKVVRVRGTSLDITQRKNAEFQLRQAKELAESANLAKSHFLANVSHEIRNPLGAISGFIKLLKNPELTSLCLKKYVNIIERNADQLLRLVDDILDLSKVEAGKMLVELMEINLPEFLSELGSLMKLRARDKNIQFNLVLVSALPIFIVSDPTRLRQILNNIIGNALKFTDQGGVRLEVSLTGQVLNFTVIDTGLGISAEQKLKLFNPFTQAEASTARKYGGTGLGLTLTQRLCEMLGGTFTLVSSAPGEGSRFLAAVKIDITESSVFLPPDQFPLEVSEPIAIAKREPKLQDMQILVVEDSADNRELIEIILSEAGAQVEFAVDGFEGLKKALARSYHVILMDIQMPKMDGNEVASRLRKEGYTAPIVALTAHAMKEEEERCLSSGFSHFLTKPIHQETMLEMLQGLMLSQPLPLRISDAPPSQLFH